MNYFKFKQSKQLNLVNQVKWQTKARCKSKWICRTTLTSRYPRENWWQDKFHTKRSNNSTNTSSTCTICILSSSSALAFIRLIATGGLFWIWATEWCVLQCLGTLCNLYTWYSQLQSRFGWERWTSSGFCMFWSFFLKMFKSF